MDPVDIVVLGGGPAGRAAATWVQRHLASVTLLDEPPRRDPRSWTGPIVGTRVWGVGRKGSLFRLDTTDGTTSERITTRALIVCTGAHDSPVPVTHRWPATEATRLLGADHEVSPSRGGVVPTLRPGQRTSVNLLYAAGDCAGLGGDAVREAESAAAAALADLGLASAAIPPAGARVDQLDTLGAVCSGLPGDTMICPCEAVSLAAIRGVISAGASGVNQIKAFTRAGMGLCQGRLCGAVLAALTADGVATARLPLRPVPMALLLGAFDYADIPVPAAAPI